VCWKPCSSCSSFHLLREDFLSAPIHSPPLWFAVSVLQSDMQPQRDLGAQATPLRTRMPNHEVRAQTLVDDARMVTPPPATNAGTQGFIGDVGASTSPSVIDVDLSTRCLTHWLRTSLHTILIEELQGNPETAGAQVRCSSSTGLTLRHREIDWNGTPWQEDVFDDNEDMRVA
jgi:hypothetical protein